jgi:hypothetical protein
MYPKKFIPQKPILRDFSVIPCKNRFFKARNLFFGINMVRTSLSMQKDGSFDTRHDPFREKNAEHKPLDGMQRAETHFSPHVVFWSLNLLAVKLWFCSVIFIL